MYLLIIFFILFLISTALAYLMKYKFEQTLAITCLATIVILYIFGLAGIMIAGVYAIYVLSAAALGLCVWGLVKGTFTKEFLLNNVFTPGFAVFCVFYIFVWLVHRDRMLIYWDEFTHWGLVVKNMYAFDAFGNHPDATTLFRGYPPASSLFHYLWMKIGGYSEPNYFRSMGVLYIALLLPVFKNINWSNIKIIPLIAIFALLSVGFYTDIYVDVLLGFLLAYILFAYFTEKSFNYSFLINMILTLSVLTLTKASGFGLALLAAVIIILDNMIKVWKSKRESCQGEDRTIKKRIMSLLASRAFHISTIAVIIPVIANFSWSIYRRVTDTGYAWGGVSNITLHSVVELLSGGADSYRYLTIVNFTSAIFSRPVPLSYFSFSYFQWILVLTVVLFIWFSKSEESHKSKLINCSIGVFVGWILYTASVAVVYIFTFTPYEAVTLAAFNRYMGTYFTASTSVFCFLFIYYVNDSESLEKKRKFFRIAVFILFNLFLFNFDAAYNLIKTPEPGARAEVTISRISSLPLDYKTDRINYIYQGAGAFYHYVARYEMTPVEVNKNEIWSVGTRDFGGNIGVIDISLNEWLELLRRDYTYVYLEHIDEEFIEQFGEAFEYIEQIKNHSLYRVVERNNIITLEYVEI